MKKSLLLLSSVFLCASIFAQGLEFSNQTDVTYGEPFSDDIGSYFTVTNTSDVERSIKVRKTVLNMDEVSTNWFCWVLCFDGTVEDSPYGITLAPGESTEEFSSHFDPNGVAADDWLMQYCFYDANDESFEFCTTVSFSTLSTVGIAETERIDLGMPQPNPANDLVRIQYNLKDVSSSQASISVFNVVGSEVLSKAVLGQEGVIELNVSDLTPGVYIYSMLDAGAILATGRLVVQ